MKIKFIIYFFAVLSIFFLITLLPGFLSLQTSVEKQAIVAANNARAGTVTVQSIFVNNFLVSLGTLIPFAGWSFIGVVLWHTGTIIASYDKPYWAITNWVVWTELSVYSFVVVQSMQIAWIQWKLKTVKPQKLTWKIMATTTAVAGTILLLSAVLEFVSIKG